MNSTLQQLEATVNEILQDRSEEYIPIVTNVIVNDDENRFGHMFLSDGDYYVESISFVHNVASTNADGAILQVAKATSTDALGASELCLVTDQAFSGGDASFKGFNLKSTAYTVQDGTMTNVASSLTLTAGDRLVFGLNGTISTTLIGLVTTLRRL